MVIYDQASLARLGLVDLPVDFKQEMVLLAAMGPAPSEDCQIQIDRVTREGNRLRVEVTSIYPSEGALRHMGAASPFHAIVVPRCELRIEGFSAKIPPQAISAKASGRS
ncbi:MAG: protease complex subunit PrcB family protein [Phycisphaerales bacterium]|nr:protease complex subunit PrcB family protein [Phycisphaerales bacterium]